MRCSDRCAAVSRLAEALTAGQSLLEACAVAMRLLDSRRDEFIAIWDFRYGNPSHSSNALCD